jgi:hypothetical protein
MITQVRTLGHVTTSVTEATEALGVHALASDHRDIDLELVAL